jgi:hypothetical protein
VSTLSEPPRTDAVPLRRPPVRQATTVRSDVGHTFDTFVRTIGAWWPVVPFSRGEGRVRDVTLEQRVGGRVYETWDDGTESDWGEILAWERPAGFTMTWLLFAEPTEVELAFRPLGPALTRVTVEHRGWERLSDAQLAQDCALRGGYLGGAVTAGWDRILTTFASALDAQADHLGSDR